MQNIYVRTAAVTIGVSIIAAMVFTLMESYSNWQEINQLTSQALDNGYGYSLVIENEFTNSYTFEIIEEDNE